MTKITPLQRHFKTRYIHRQTFNGKRKNYEKAITNIYVLSEIKIYKAKTEITARTGKCQDQERLERFCNS